MMMKKATSTEINYRFVLTETELHLAIKQFVQANAEDLPPDLRCEISVDSELGATVTFTKRVYE